MFSSKRGPIPTVDRPLTRPLTRPLRRGRSRPVGTGSRRGRVSRTPHLRSARRAHRNRRARTADRKRRCRDVPGQAQRRRPPGRVLRLISGIEIVTRQDVRRQDVRRPRDVSTSAGSAERATPLRDVERARVQIGRSALYDHPAQAREQQLKLAVVSSSRCEASSITRSRGSNPNSSGSTTQSTPATARCVSLSTRAPLREVGTQARASTGRFRQSGEGPVPVTWA